MVVYPVDPLIDIMSSSSANPVSTNLEIGNEDMLTTFPPLSPGSLVMNNLQKKSDAPSWADRVVGHAGTNTSMSLRFIEPAQADSKIIVSPLLRLKL